MKEPLWNEFWPRVSSVSIRLKIMGIVAMGITVSTLALVWHTYQDTAVILRTQLQQRGIAIGNTLAIYSSDLTIPENLPLLYRLARNVREADKDVAYVFVLNTRGDVLVQTPYEGAPAEFIGKNQVLPGETYHIQAFQTENDTIQEVAIPIQGDNNGVIRLGLTEASINSVLKQRLKDMVLWAALIFVLWLFIANGLTSILTMPVSRLLEAARAAGQGDFHWQAPIGTKKDEIGLLGVAFGKISKELKRREEMRQQLLNKVINAQEEERKRIARELHDQTGQSLTSLMVGLKLLETHSLPESQQSIADLKQLAATILAGVHNLSLDLRPSSIDDLGLIAALRQYTKGYTTKFGIDTDFQAVGLEDKRLPPTTEIALYRIVQEALTNIVKHAAATKVIVLLKVRDTSIVVIVEDNGKGFDVKEKFTSGRSEHSLGLYGMKERASVLGGTLTIESTPGMGTTIFVEVPLEEDKGSPQR